MSALTLMLIAGHPAAQTGATDSPESPHYVIKQDIARESRIKGNVAEWVFPFDKSWAALSPSEKGRVRNYYTDLKDTDEPPFPLNGHAPITKTVAQIQQKMLVTGQLFLIARVNVDGNADEVRVLQTPDKDVSTAVAYVIMKSKFKPALCDGAPCAMNFPFCFNFHVRN